KDQRDTIAGCLPLTYLRNIDTPTQRCFECEALALVEIPSNLSEHEPPRMNGCAGRIEWRQPGRDQIGIDEIRTCGVLRKILLGKGCLARTIRTRNHDNVSHVLLTGRSSCAFAT